MRLGLSQVSNDCHGPHITVTLATDFEPSAHGCLELQTRLLRSPIVSVIYCENEGTRRFDQPQEMFSYSLSSQDNAE